jgi:two-component system response regulator GlrR
MESHRVAVIAHPSSAALAESLSAQIRCIDDFKVESKLWDLRNAPSARSASVAIWVVSRGDAAEVASHHARVLESRRSVLLAACPADDLALVGPMLEPFSDDFIVLPATPVELSMRLRRAVGGPSAAPEHGEVDPRLKALVGVSPAFVAQLARLPKLAACDAGVLILGETGTGKELCAQAIHYLSPRASHPCVAVNCGAIPVELVESELFGHVRGAFTNAHEARHGLVAEAERGTLFLDDIDCLPLAAQAKFLRFLQEHEYRPLGARGVRRADVRVIAASNQRLREMVVRGTFRQDLYFRLNVLNVELPPLRERREDIAALARHFAAHFARQFNRPVASLTPGALKRLMAYSWPGNVRELEHVIERAVLLCSASLLTELDVEVGNAAHGALDDDSFRAAKMRVVQEFERSRIEQLLTIHSGNVTRAAAAARKNRRAFIALMRKYKIESEAFRPVS